MKQVVGYIRVSTDGQVGDDKYGMEAQEIAIRDYCSKNDLELTKIYCDAGKSGAKDDRPELDKILYGIVQNPPIEAVVVAASDRIARDIKLYFYYEFIMQQKGIELISVKENFAEAGEFAPMMKTLIVMMAEMERKNIKKRTMAGRMVKASRGGYCGGKVPFGYRVEENEFVIDEREGEIVRRCFEYRRGGMATTKIAKILQSEGVVNRKGEPITHNTVNAILRKEKVYQGYYKYGKHGEWVKGKHEPLIK